MTVTSPTGTFPSGTVEFTRMADGTRDEYQYLHATRGELLRRLGRTDEARDAYGRALALAHDDAERRLLERRLAALGAPAGR